MAFFILFAGLLEVEIPFVIMDRQIHTSSRTIVLIKKEQIRYATPLLAVNVLLLAWAWDRMLSSRQICTYIPKSN
jgi:hypothetical protein